VAQTPEGAGAWIAALGGAGNLKSVDACTTRLRLLVNDHDAVLEGELKALGARGLVRPGGDSLQVLVGPQADQLAGDINAALKRAGVRVEQPSHTAESVTAGTPLTDEQRRVASALIAALGDRAKIKSCEAHLSRLRVQVVDDAKVDEAKVRALDVRGIARPAPNVLHFFVGPAALQLEAILRTE